MRFAVAILLFVIAAAAEWGVSALRPSDNPVLAESAFAAFGGFRALAAEAVWFRADRLQDEGRYVELAELARALTLAEPHTPEVWSYAAWNLAYNVSVMMPTPADRWRWVDAAITLLRDEGLTYNPDSAELHRELAWLFQLKLGGSLDDAAAHYRREWSARVRDVAARNAWEELRMDPAKMAEIERTLGIDDREDPLYSAIYWAADGLRVTRGKGQDARFLAEIVRQSMIVYFKRHPRQLPAGAEEAPGPRAPKAGPFRENARG